MSGGVGGNAVGVGVSVDVGEDMGVRARITVEVDCGAVVAVVMGVDTGVAIVSRWLRGSNLAELASR